VFALIHKVYVGLGSVSFLVKVRESDTGTSWKQSVTIRFPSTDETDLVRLELMQRLIS
jgi:hypothetical protein